MPRPQMLARRLPRFIVFIASLAAVSGATVSASGPFTVPQVANLAAVVPLALSTNCLVRAEQQGTQVEQTSLCYSVEGVQPLPPPPPPPPPPYDEAIHETLFGSLNPSTGVVTTNTFACTEIFPGAMAVKVDFVMPLSKTGGAVSGSTVLLTDTVPPFDCASGVTTNGPLTLTPLVQSHDHDLDGCADWEELGSAQASGGLRDPFNFWDFYDVPTGSPLARNKAVAAPDFFQVVGRFGTTGDPAGDPLSTPPPTGYHTAYDRGAAIGPDAWNLTQADGAITGPDQFRVLAQFGHTCAPAP